MGIADADAGRAVGEARFVRHRRWALFFAVLWCVFLVPTLQSAWERRATTGWWGVAATAAFVVVYVVGFDRWVRRSARAPGTTSPTAPVWAHLAVLLAIAALMVATAGPEGAVAAFYVVIAATFRLPVRTSAAVALVVAVALWSLARCDGYERLEGVWLYSFVGFAVAFSVVQLMRRNVELVHARAENERLVLEAERLRMARDLHDILGHSLTVITVKSELAGAMLDAGSPAALVRARTEVADLERMARDALADVRATAHGYRDVSLPAELARAGEALRAAGVRADLPSAADAVPTHLRELFAWTVREGVTNVVRHSGATRCAVELGPDRVVVRDDGAGGGAPLRPQDASASDGAGLRGLRERAAAVGATVLVGRDEHGFALEVSR